MLETLNITSNPIIEGQSRSYVLLAGRLLTLSYDISGKHSRAIFVAKLPVLKSLNGGTASPAQLSLCLPGFDATITPIL